MSESELEVLEMIVIEPVTVLEAYTRGDSLEFAIEQVRAVVECFEHDMSTVAGRKRTASLAAKIPRVKTALDKMGKDLTAKWKSQAKVVDNSRKDMREALDDLKVEARKPLTEWEEAQEKREADREAREKAEELAAQLESDHEFGLLMNEKIDRDAAEEAAALERWTKEEEARVERERQEREKQIAAEAAEKAEREASQKIADAEAATARANEEAKAAAERAEREKVEAATQARLKAEREAQQREDARIAEEKRIQDEQEKREADKDHRRKINNAILSDLMKAGLDETTGKHLIRLITTSQIAHTQIQY